MKFIKRHKILVAFIVVLVILVSFILYILNMFSFDKSVDVYGPRLAGIDKVKISDKTIKKLEKEMESKEEVSNVDYRLQGRLIYIRLKFKEDVNLDKAKEIANATLEFFDDEEKEYYDIQLILLNKKGVEGFPKFGYKHKSNEGIVW